MAWRIEDQVVRVILDNRIPGMVIGKVWLAGRNDPLQLNLAGNPRRDIAGRFLVLERSGAVKDPLGGLATEQRGVCGDLTASRKVRTPLPAWAEGLNHCSEEWHNAVYLEWFSERNGRVVIELIGVSVDLSEPSWTLTPEQERVQLHLKAEAIRAFLDQFSSSPTHPHQQLLQEESHDHVTDQALEQQIRIASLKAQVRELCGGAMSCGPDDHVPLDIQERFWQNVLEFEANPYPQKKVRELLAEDGFVPSPGEGLPDDVLETQLERLIRALFRRGLLLSETDHLSDRELYSLLAGYVLELEVEAYPIDSGWFTDLQLSELGAPDGEDGTQVYLRYYADENDRQAWAEDFPQLPLPPSQEPPYDRDRWLPRP
jgi:hypothetical protein